MTRFRTPLPVQACSGPGKQTTDTDTSETLISSLLFCSLDLGCTCSRKTEKQSAASPLLQTGHPPPRSLLVPLHLRYSGRSRNRFFTFSRNRNRFAEKRNQAQATRSCNATSLPRTVPQPPQRQSKARLILAHRSPASGLLASRPESPNATSKPALGTSQSDSSVGFDSTRFLHHPR